MIGRLERICCRAMCTASKYPDEQFYIDEKKNWTCKHIHENQFEIGACYFVVMPLIWKHKNFKPTVSHADPTQQHLRAFSKETFSIAFSFFFQ